jgi:hypothetical protein
VAASLLADGDDTVYASGYADRGFRAIFRGMTPLEVEELVGKPIEEFTFSEVVRPWWPQSHFGEVVSWKYSTDARGGSYRRGVVDNVVRDFHLD